MLKSAVFTFFILLNWIQVKMLFRRFLTSSNCLYIVKSGTSLFCEFGLDFK